MSARRGILRCLALYGAILGAASVVLLSLLLFSVLPAAARASDPVRVQLMWRNQAQFTGLYVALAKGFYDREHLKVTLVEGGPGINPIDQLTIGKADVAIAWLPSVIAAREQGRNVVNIAQIFQRPGIAIACRRDAGVETPDDIVGKTIGVWNVGDQLDLRYWLGTIGIPLNRVTIVPQRADGQDLIDKRVACATVMTYNEYWRLLSSGLTPGDLLLVRLSDNGLGFLEDGLYVTTASLQDAHRRAVLIRFLRATLAGWRYTSEHEEEALAITMAVTPHADPVHQRRMLDAILPLLGDPAKIGLLDLNSYQHSIALIADETNDPAAVHAAAAGWTERLWRRATSGRQGFFQISEVTRYYLTEVLNAPWFHALDLIGTAAFGFAGFMRAQQRHYDLWGALILTLLPAVGGGTLRDLLVGGSRSPPFIFKDPVYTYIVLGTVGFGTLISHFLTPKTVGSHNFERVLVVFDTVGLSAFTVIGASVAITADLSWFWIPFCAALTCAGGGMLLDVITGREPRTFQGEPYEEIAVFGGLLLFLGLCIDNRFEHAPQAVIVTIIATLTTVFTLRIVVVAFRLRSYRLRIRQP